MPSFRDLLNATKAEIREVSTAEADEIRKPPGALVLDVPEPEDNQHGATPGAVPIARRTPDSPVEPRLTTTPAPALTHDASRVPPPSSPTPLPTPRSPPIRPRPP